MTEFELNTFNISKQYIGQCMACDAIVLHKKDYPGIWDESSEYFETISKDMHDDKENHRSLKQMIEIVVGTKTVRVHLNHLNSHGIIVIPAKTEEEYTCVWQKHQPTYESN